jgi:glycosyltransferase involved in cell wall biosynthesis
VTSVARQTYGRIEHLVMDGGSTDGTTELLASRARPGLRWWSEADGGQSDALNKAFHASTGEIIGWLNSDDAYFDDGVVQAAVRAFEADPDTAVVYGHAALVNGEGLVLQLIWAPPFSGRLLRLHDFLCQPAVFIRRSAIADRLVDPSFHYAMDYELWLRLARDMRFRRLNRILAIDRHHPDRKSYTWLDAADRDRAILHERHGVPRRSTPVKLAQKVIKVGLRLAGASLVATAARDASRLGWTVDDRQLLLRRQLLFRRASMPMGKTT